MRHRTALLTATLCGVTTLLAAPAASQEILLRYEPRERMVVRTTSETDIDVKMALGGLIGMIAAMGEGLAQAFGDTSDVEAMRDSIEAAMAQFSEDSMTVQMRMQLHLTELVIEARDGKYVVQRTIDSAMARIRAQDEGWENQDMGEAWPQSARLVVDDRLRVSDFQLLTADTAARNLPDFLRSPHGGFALTLPEGPVSPGTTWRADVTFPFNLGETMGAGAGQEEGPPSPIERAELVSQARITLDSVLVRGPDTLAYLRARGEFEPVTETRQNEMGEGTATLSGAFAGVFVWSTAWSTFVSGSSRAQLVMDAQFGAGEEEPGAGFGMGMRFTVTNRFQVRP
ncbi:MAG: hypothetical protein ACE5PT_01600 [Gemmatimonadales bacterium]